jgi:hypothetical protein
MTVGASVVPAKAGTHYPCRWWSERGFNILPHCEGGEYGSRLARKSAWPGRRGEVARYDIDCAAFGARSFPTVIASEAKQSRPGLAADKTWVASSLALLAMTVGASVVPAEAGTHYPCRWWSERGFNMPPHCEGGEYGSRLARKSAWPGRRGEVARYVSTALRPGHDPSPPSLRAKRSNPGPGLPQIRPGLLRRLRSSQ